MFDKHMDDGNLDEGREIFWDAFGQVQSLEKVHNYDSSFLKRFLSHRPDFIITQYFYSQI